MGKLYKYIVKLYTISCQESVSQHFRSPSSKILCYLVSYYGLIYKKTPTTFVHKLEKSSFRNSNKKLPKNFEVPTKLNRKLKHRIKNATISAFRILSKNQQRDAHAYTEMSSGGYILLVKNKGQALLFCPLHLHTHMLYSAQILF